jgi:MoaA/NifB/PqqE/SkfB family radical SAM enzyme
MQQVIYNIDEIMPYKAGYVLVILNMKCFFRCKMCDIWKNKSKEKYLDLKIYNKFFNDLAKIKGENTFINFGGGELLMHPDIFEIISYAAGNGFSTNLNTNGWLLDDKIVKKLFDSGISCIGFSLDGSTPQLHDFIRGFPGSYARLFENAKKLKAYFRNHGKDINITVCLTLMSLNMHDAANVAQLVQKTDFIDSIVIGAVSAPFFSQEISKVIGNNEKFWFETKEYSHLWPKDHDQIKKAYDVLIKLKKDGYKISTHEHRLRMQCNYFLNPKVRLQSARCTVNRNLIIEMNGDTFHCNIKKEKIGNILEKPIYDIWNSFSAIEMRKRVIDCKVNCHELLNCDSIDPRLLPA